ncbi:MAG: hypothetical protein M3336_10655 [Chloroflexota bacterium]|nr:hypothetical protein [Chloroflexota bacterium]
MSDSLVLRQPSTLMAVGHLVPPDEAAGAYLADMTERGAKAATIARRLVVISLNASC